MDAECKYQSSQSEALREEAFEQIGGALDKGIILLCDHASNRLPEGYGTLGLPQQQLERHIGYDIGAAAVTKKMASILGVPAVLSRFSRLLIDPNRGMDDPTLIMRLSDGAVVPGNARMNAEEAEHRIKNYYAPYHAAIATLIDQALGSNITPTLLSIHSFTPVWAGQPRNWHITILWDNDQRLAKPLVASLRQEKELNVGENVPYSGRLKGDCMYRHGTKRGLPHALVELRQDLIRTEQGQDEWAQRLARHMKSLQSNTEVQKDLQEVKFFGTYSGERGKNEHG